MDWIIRGGIIMWPIMLGSIVALYLIIERAIFLLSILPARRKALTKVVEKIEESGKRLDLPDPANFVKAVNSAIDDGAVNQSLLMREADELVSEAEKGLTMLSVIAQVEPLLGLLGTVTGLIRAFIEISNLGVQVTPSDLASGIWEALITTAAGLFIGIPALVAWMGYNRAADRYAVFVESSVLKIIHKLSRSGLEII